LVGLAFDLGELLAQVQRGLERSDLLLQALDQFKASAIRNPRDVINGFLAIELGALAPHMGQGVDQMAMHTLQAQLENLKQAHGACANDQRFGVDG
jgi:hypothetical protein